MLFFFCLSSSSLDYFTLLPIESSFLMNLKGVWASGAFKRDLGEVNVHLYRESGCYLLSKQQT